MQIINHGNSYNKCVCEKCQCEFEYVKKDTWVEKEERTWVWQKPRWKKTYVFCPECGACNLVKKEDI